MPKRWEPKDSSIPHIPYTLPPKQPPGKGKDGKTPGKAAGGRGGKRKRSLAPSAWNQGAFRMWQELCCAHGLSGVSSR